MNFQGRFSTRNFCLLGKKPHNNLRGRRFLKPIKIAVFKILGYGPSSALHMLFSCHSNWFFKSLLFNQTLWASDVIIADTHCMKITQKISFYFNFFAMTFDLFYIVKKFCPNYFQSKVLKYRARANRKTLKCPKMISKSNFRNLILKNYEEYLIYGTCFIS